MTDIETNRRAFAFTIVAVLAATVVAYWPSLSVPFQFDDYARITGNWNLHAGRWLRAIGQLGGSRVLPASSIALNFWVSGDETLGYHVVNLLVHLGATGAVLWLAVMMARTPRVTDGAVAVSPRFFAAATAAIFACHPLQTQAVTYIIQRSASMATMFYVASVAAYLSGRLAQLRRDPATSRFVLSIALAAAALLSKENAVTLPLSVLLAEVAFFGRRHVGRLLRLGLYAAPVLALPVAFKMIAWRYRRGADVGATSFIDAVLAQGPGLPPGPGPLEYFLTQMLVVPRYLWLVLFPLGLNVDHDVPLAAGVDRAVVFGALLLGALLVSGLWCLRRAPVVGFGLLWILVTLSVESSFIPIHDVMMEHRMYLAMPGVAVLGAFALTSLARANRTAAYGAAVVTVGLLATLTYQRNQVWQSAISLWSDAAAKSPGKARVQVNVGVAYHGNGDLDQAVEHYCKALEIDPEIALARDNIEIALEQQGRLDEVLAELKPKPVQMPDAPPGTIVLEYDVSEVACRPNR